MKLLRNICICAILFLALFSCGKRARIIPKKEMAKIYAELYIADQWLISHSNYRSQADTSFFYEPIFQKYGYTTEDYRESVYHYLKDAKRYSAILESSADIIKEKLDVLKAIQKAEDLKRKRLERIADYEYYDEFEDISYFNLLKDDVLIPNTVKVELDSSKLNKTVVIKVFRDTLSFEQAFERKFDELKTSAESDSLKINVESDSVNITKSAFKMDSLKNSSAKLLKDRMENLKPLLDTTTHLVKVAK